MGDFLPNELVTLAHAVATLLEDRKETVCVAETAAGGLISASLLSYPGASKIYRGGLTLYTLESRAAFAGWTEQDTKDYKGPTPEIVSKLAKNVRKTLGATYCVCESGTAGPTGGDTRNRTPGYVALAVASEAGTQTKEMDTLETGHGSDRQKNMVAFAAAALNLLKEAISSSSDTETSSRL